MYGKARERENLLLAALAALAFVSSTAHTQDRDVRPDVRLPAETAGWDKVVEGLLSAFADDGWSPLPISARRAE